MTDGIRTNDDLARMDDELIKETLDRKPSPFGKLFEHVPNGVNAEVRTSMIVPSGLVDDYFKLAEECALRVDHGTDADQKIMPVLFLYRHAVELALKIARQAVIRAIKPHEPNFDPGKLDKHELKILLDDLRGLHRRVNPYLKNSVGKVKFISEQAETFILELDDIDATGQGFRYAADKDGNVVVKDANVGIEALMAGMLHVQKELSWYTSMIEISADLLADWTAEMEAEYGGWY